MQKNNNISSQTPFDRVLIARFSALGDVAMTIPVIYSVCNDNPHTRFMMLTQSVAASLFINAPDNLQVMGIKTADYKGLGGLFRLYKEIKANFDPQAFVDLHGVIRTYILSLFFVTSGVKVQHIDKGRAGKRALTRRRGKRLLPLISSRTRYREVFHRLGFEFKYEFLSLFGEQKAPLNTIDDITLPRADADEKWIAIAPFAKHKGKIYPLGKMEQVVDALSQRPGVKLFLFGAGNEERDILAQWETKYPNTTSLAAKRYGFAKELALLSNCDVMVSMDSANMHLSSLVNLPVVSIWGATHPYCGFLGFRQEESNAVQLNMPCRPCSVFGNKPCATRDYYCLDGIRPEMILNAIEKVLSNKIR